MKEVFGKLRGSSRGKVILAGRKGWSGGIRCGVNVSVTATRTYCWFGCTVWGRQNASWLLQPGCWPEPW